MRGIGNMYCQNCGKKIDEHSKFCTNCGVKLTNTISNVDSNVNNPSTNSNGMKVVSIVLGSLGIFGSLLVIFAPIGLILSIIGLILGICALRKGSNLPGILLSSIGLVLSLAISVIMMIFIFAIVDETSNHKYDWVEEFNENFDFDDYYGEKFKDIIDQY